MIRLKSPLSLVLAALTSFIVIGCSSNNLQDGMYLSCTASGTALSSGIVSVAGQEVSVSNIMVSISDGVGPFMVTIPGASQTETSTPSYTYPGTISMATTGTGTVSGSVTVTDTSTNGTTSCPITVNGGLLTGDTGLTVISASGNTNLPLGTPITLTAEPTSGLLSTAMTYSFAITPILITGVTITNTGTSTASITATTPTTVTVTVTGYETGSTLSAAATGTITLTFGTGGVAGTGSVILTPSTGVTTAAVGTPIVLTANYIAAPGTTSFTFEALNSIPGITVTPQTTIGGLITSATVMSTVPGSVTVEAIGMNNPAAIGTITLQFYGAGGTTGIGSLICSLGHQVGTDVVGIPIYFNVVTNTGEPVNVTYWNTGEPWGSPPPYPIRPPMSVVYTEGGQMNVQVTASSAISGIPCNGGAPLTDTLFVSGSPYPY